VHTTQLLQRYRCSNKGGIQKFSITYYLILKTAVNNNNNTRAFLMEKKLLTAYIIIIRGISKTVCYKIR